MTSFRYVMRVMTLTTYVLRYRKREIDRDELFIALTALVSLDTSLLSLVRSLLSPDPQLRSEFETWLGLLTAGTRFRVMDTDFVYVVSPELVSIVARERVVGLS